MFADLFPGMLDADDEVEACLRAARFLDFASWLFLVAKIGCWNIYIYGRDMGIVGTR